MSEACGVPDDAKHSRSLSLTADLGTTTSKRGVWAAFFPAWVHAWCISGPGDLHCMKKFSVFFNLDIESQLGSLRFEDCVRMGYVAD
jgi:hypothetical protein